MFLKLPGIKKSSSPPSQAIGRSDFKSSSERGIHPNWLIILASLLLATLGNLALWQELIRLPEMNDLRAVWFGASFALLIAALIAIVLSLLSWRWTLKPAISIFLITAAVGGYFMLSYGVVIDSTMMINVLQTDLRESRDLTSWKLLLVILVFAILPMVWLWRLQVKHLSVLRQLGHNTLLFIAGCALSVLAVLPTYQDFASTMRNNIQLRFLVNPLNSFYALSDVLLQPFQNSASAIVPLGLDAKLGASYANQPQSPLLVLVVGETARSGNFGINGYGRETTPALIQLQKNSDQRGELTSFRNAWSCGTSTATALPCMFSHLGKSAFEDSSQSYENLVDVLQRAGLAVIWLENQSGCKGLCDRVLSVSTGRLNDPQFCNTGECFDEMMLQQLSERMAALPIDRLDKGIVVIMHQMGSHGPAYYKRVPEAFKKFLPECTTNILQDCTRAQVTNAYDNTLLYTDHFLNSVVKFLKDIHPHAQTAMMYVADHGESLGENNIYLHGLPYAIAPDVQKRVPWISWLSNDFLQRNHINPACLNQQKDKRLSHDNYFHSVLGLLDIQTTAYKPELDVYAPCKSK
ncbi:MAG: phosphoethanolamine--lipid A transferase [Burkholderiaceae bacterium]|nr:phosphoethanolamine--lipid A transferase [Burkholderiaceae bacterium]